MPTSITISTMSEITFNSLAQLDNAPLSYERIRREYLWKQYLYKALGPRHMQAINEALNELYLVGCKNQVGVGAALGIVLKPNYQPQLILHKYPDVVEESVEYLLKGTNEHIIDPHKLEEGHKYAIEQIRIALNNIYYTST